MDGTTAVTWIVCAPLIIILWCGAAAAVFSVGLLVERFIERTIGHRANG